LTDSPVAASLVNHKTRVDQGDNIITTSTTTLNNDVQIPQVGFEVFQIPSGEKAYEAVRTALRLGYRAVDTADANGNEESVGRVIGVSNFLIHHLETLLETAEIIPTVPQPRTDSDPLGPAA
jgi:diketogulonate reductase-like aldo/keto reductase